MARPVAGGRDRLTHGPQPAGWPGRGRYPPSRREFSKRMVRIGQFPGPLEWSAVVGIGGGGPRVDPFGQSLLGSKPVEQREELLTLGGLEAATEL
jgi:hypothetical protein